MRGSILRILVTGAKGMLGSDACEVLAEVHEIIAYDIDDFDIVDRAETLGALESASPEAIVHLAAFTDVEACEDERDRAFKCNALGTMNVATAARKIGAYLVYVSTDYVFDGAKGKPYIEVDEPSPLNFYGLTKLYGERYIQDLTLQHLIIRTSWLFGPKGRNFVDTIVARASEGGSLQVVNDQRGCPTYTLDLARGIRQAIEHGLEGIVHMTNSGEATWFELAKYAIDLAGLETDVKPVSSESYPTKARRPSYSVLGSLVLETSGIGTLPPWRQAVKHHLLRKGVLKERGRVD